MSHSHFYHLKNRLRGVLPTSLKGDLKQILANDTSGRLISNFYRHKIPYRGFKVAIEPRVRSRIAAQLFWRFYERIELDQIEAFLPPDLDVVELGASIGVSTMLIARKLAPGRRVVALEADPTIGTVAIKNYKLNGLDDRITLVSSAAGYPRGRAQFLRSSNTEGGKIADATNAQQTYEVEIMTLSDVLDKHGIDECVLVADIEGAEAGLILDDAASLRRCRRIFIELHETTYKGREYSKDDLIALIEASGFRVIDRYRASAVFERIGAAVKPVVGLS